MKAFLMKRFQIVPLLKGIIECMQTKNTSLIPDFNCSGFCEWIKFYSYSFCCLICLCWLYIFISGLFQARSSKNNILQKASLTDNLCGIPTYQPHSQFNPNAWLGWHKSHAAFAPLLFFGLVFLGRGGGSLGQCSDMCCPSHRRWASYVGLNSLELCPQS